MASTPKSDMTPIIAAAKAWVDEAVGMATCPGYRPKDAESAFTAAITALVERAEKAEGENKRLRLALEPWAELLHLAGEHAPEHKIVTVSVAAGDLRRAQPSREE